MNNSPTVPTWFAIKHWVKLMVGIFVFITVCAYWPFHSVPTGSRGVITRFGAITGIEQEGLVVLYPWQTLNSFSIRAETATIDGAQGSTSDTQPVSVSMTVRYSIIPNQIAMVFEKYSHDGDLSSYVQTATQEVFKAVTSKYTAPDLIAKRAQVSDDIRMALQTKLAIYGAQVISIDMRNFSFSDAYMKAIEAKVTQEQLRLAAENEVLTVVAEQKKKVAVADAEAKAVEAKADGDAYAVSKDAEAQAHAIQVQGTALVSNPSVLELRRIEVEMKKADSWDGKLPTAIYAGAPIPFLNVK